MANWSQIPPELFEKIAAELFFTHQKSFYNLTLVNTRWRELGLNELYKYYAYNDIEHTYSYWIRHGESTADQMNEYTGYFEGMARTSKIFDLISKFKVNLSFYELLTSNIYQTVDFTCFYLEDYGKDFLFWYIEDSVDQLKSVPKVEFSHDGHILMKTFISSSNTVQYISLNPSNRLVPVDVEGEEFSRYDGVNPYELTDYQVLPKPDLPIFKNSINTICFYDMNQCPKPESKQRFNKLQPRRLKIEKFMNFDESITYAALSIDRKYLAVSFYGLVKIYALDLQNYNDSKIIFSKQYPSKVSYLGLTSNAQVLFLRAERLGGLSMVNLMNNEEIDFPHYRLDLTMCLQNDYTLILSGFKESYIYGLPKHNNIDKIPKYDLTFPPFERSGESIELQEAVPRKKRKLAASSSSGNKTWDYFNQCSEEPVAFDGREILQLENGAAYLLVEKGEVSIQVNAKFLKGKFFLKYLEDFLGIEYYRDHSRTLESFTYEAGEFDRCSTFDRQKKLTMKTFLNIDNYSCDEVSNYGSDTQLSDTYKEAIVPMASVEEQNDDQDSDVSEDEFHNRVQFNIRDNSDSDGSSNYDSDGNYAQSDKYDNYESKEWFPKSDTRSYNDYARPFGENYADSENELNEDHNRYIKRKLLEFNPGTSGCVYAVSKTGRRAAILVNDLLYILNTSWQAIWLLNNVIENLLVSDLQFYSYPFPIIVPVKSLKHKKLLKHKTVTDSHFLNGSNDWLLKCKVQLKNLLFVADDPNVSFIDDDRVVINYDNDKCLIYEISSKRMSP